MTDRLPRDRYDTWRQNQGKLGTAGRDEPLWDDISISRQAAWVRDVEPEFNRRIRECGDKDEAAFPYWVGAAVLFVGTIWLMNYFDVLGK